MADTYDPVYQQDSWMVYAPDGSLTVRAPVNRSSGMALPQGTSFQMKPESDSVFWVGPIGELDISAGIDTDSGTKYGTVLVTYEDGSVDEVPVSVTVVNDFYKDQNQSFIEGDQTVTWNDSVSAGPLYDPAYEFYIGASENPSWVTVDFYSGYYFAAPPAGTRPGVYKVKVEGYGKFNGYGYWSGNVTVLAPAGTPDSWYKTTDYVVKQKETLNIAKPTHADGSQITESYTYSFATDTPAWAQISSDGSISLSPDAKVSPGKYTLTVLVSAENGTSYESKLNVTVEENQSMADRYSLDWDGEETSTVNADGSLLLNPVKLDDGKVLPADSIVTWSADWYGDSAYSTITENNDGSVDLILTSKLYGEYPDGLSLTLSVVYPDGSVDKQEKKIVWSTPLLPPQPSIEPSPIPATDPSAEPTAEPSHAPSTEPTAVPSEVVASPSASELVAPVGSPSTNGSSVSTQNSPSVNATAQEQAVVEVSPAQSQQAKIEQGQQQVKSDTAQSSKAVPSKSLAYTGVGITSVIAVGLAFLGLGFVLIRRRRS